MPDSTASAMTGRTMGLAGATGVGIGAIVGGGILALAGVAFMTTGPGAMLAFALNGVIAVITALSFSELSTRFPASGGTYTFAKRVLSLETAFAVGWVVWFASIVAAVLYAIGFAAFAAVVLEHAVQAATGSVPGWLHGRVISVALGALATAFFTAGLLRAGGGGGAWINVGKIVVFAILIAGGLVALVGSPAGTLRETLTPFLPGGMTGLVQAMGFTFIALQGFDLIAAVAGEVRDPSRTLPRAMLLSLATALAIYLPLLFVIAAVGVAPGTGIAALSAENPETVVAVAAGRYLGAFGYWFVVVAAILSMLSALQANLFAASRVAQAMAADRTLPPALEKTDARFGVPRRAVLVTAVLVFAILIVLPDVAAAGAASSLIFLVTFTLAHVITVLARVRVGMPEHAFRTPLFPLVPVAGGLMCLALAVFQAFAVPAAGRIAGIWLGLGAVLFVTLFARRARVREAVAAATDPHLMQLRGHSPLVLVPVANPRHAPAMAQVANALAAPGVGRVLLLNIVTHKMLEEAESLERALSSAQTILREALLRANAAGIRTEALTTMAADVWVEIARVARTHDCESLLIGLTRLDEASTGAPLETLLARVDRDLVILRAPDDLRLVETRRIMVAVGGRGDHDVLRARLVASLRRGAEREITYVRVVGPDTPPDRRSRARRTAERLALDEAGIAARVDMVESASVTEALVQAAGAHDLAILGLQRHRRRGRVFGDVATEIARRTDTAIILIGRGR